MENSAKDDVFRRGPSPLPVHIGLAMAEYGRLQQSGEVAPAQMKAMLDGIRKYQHHSFKRQIEPLPVIWECGQLKISCAKASEPKASVLLVPSLINKSSILDLLPQRSFVRWLAAQNINTYLLDWGQPTEDEGQANIDELILNRLVPAIEHVSEQSDDKIHALGYCMGGTILCAASMFKRECLASIICLASPWDFEAGDRKLTDQVKQGTPAAMQVINAKGHLPMDWIQSVFAAVNADRAMKKFSEFNQLQEQSDEANLFVAVEDWLNDGIDLPAKLAKNFIIDWYGENKTNRAAWKVNDQIIDISSLNVPSLIVASNNDKLVPLDSSRAMANELPLSTFISPSSGHIGMMSGRKAREQVWEPVANWVLRGSL